MEFTSVITSFLTAYQVYLIPLFALGIIMMIIPTYSMAFAAFSIIMFVLYSIMGLEIFVHLAIASIVIAFIVKYLGL